MPAPASNNFAALGWRPIPAPKSKCNALGKSCEAWLKNQIPQIQISRDVAHRNRYQSMARHLTTCVTPTGSPVHAWEVTATRCPAARGVEREGLAATTINQRLAACSSYYSFVRNEKGADQRHPGSAASWTPPANAQQPFMGGNVQRRQSQTIQQAANQRGDTHPLQLLESKGHHYWRPVCLCSNVSAHRLPTNVESSAANKDIEPNPSQPGSFIIFVGRKGAKEEREVPGAPPPSFTIYRSSAAGPTSVPMNTSSSR